MNPTDGNTENKVKSKKGQTLYIRQQETIIKNMQCTHKRNCKEKLTFLS